MHENLAGTLARHGFPVWGVLPAERPPRFASYTRWIDAGYHGTMGYLARHMDLRQNPLLLMPDTRSYLLVGLPYRTSRWISFLQDPFHGISHYAWGIDYHRVLRRKLKEALREIRDTRLPSLRFRIFVDTAPVLERDLSAAAGLGWIGKNTCLIHPTFGSYLFLGGALLSEDISGTPPPPPPRRSCGRCTRCMEVCPTGALKEPYLLDARLCLSYRTIEDRDGESGAGDTCRGWIFGCDLCQEVCPFNRKADLSRETSFLPRWGSTPPAREDLLSLTGETFREWVRGSAMERVTHEQFQRNLLRAGSWDLPGFPPLRPDLQRSLSTRLGAFVPPGRFLLTGGPDLMIRAEDGPPLALSGEERAALRSLTDPIQLLRDYPDRPVIVDNREAAEHNRNHAEYTD